MAVIANVGGKPVAEFPDGTSPDVVQRVVKGIVGGKYGEQSSNPLNPTGMMERMIQPKSTTPAKPSAPFRPVRNLGASMAEGVNLGAAGVASGLNTMYNYLNDKLKMGARPDFFKKAVEMYNSNAQYWEGIAKRGGVSTALHFLGKAIGEAPAGIADFAAGMGPAAIKGAARAKEKGKSEVVGAAKGAAERFLMGKVLHQTGKLTPIPRVGVSAGVFAGQTAAQGGTPEQVGEAAITGAMYGVPGGKGSTSVKDLKNAAVDLNKELGEKGAINIDPKDSKAKAEEIKQQLKGEKTPLWLDRGYVPAVRVDDNVHMTGIGHDAMKDIPGMRDAKELETGWVNVRTGKFTNRMDTDWEKGKDTGEVIQKWRNKHYEGKPESDWNVPIGGVKPESEQLKDVADGNKPIYLGFENDKEHDELAMELGLKSIPIREGHPARVYVRPDREKELEKNIQTIKETHGSHEEWDTLSIGEKIKAGKALGYNDKEIEDYIGAPLGLRPAVRLGKTVTVGEVGDTHPDVMKKHNIGPDAEHERGFVGPDGKFMTRARAKQWMKKNNPELYDEWVKTVEEGGEGKKKELHSQDLNKAQGLPAEKGGKDDYTIGKGRTGMVWVYNKKGEPVGFPKEGESNEQAIERVRKEEAEYKASNTLYRGSKGGKSYEGGKFYSRDKEYASSYGEVSSIELGKKDRLLVINEDKMSAKARKILDEYHKENPKEKEDVILGPTKKWIEFLKKKGYSGVELPVSAEVFMFDKENNGNNGSTLGMGLGGAHDTILKGLDRWLSPTKEHLHKHGENKAPAEEWIKRVEAWGSKNPHIKDENTWNGLTAWLDSKKGEKGGVQKNDIMEFLELSKGNWVVREQVYGEVDKKKVMAEMKELDRKMAKEGINDADMERYGRLYDQLEKKGDDPWADRNVPGGIPGTAKVWTLTVPSSADRIAEIEKKERKVGTDGLTAEERSTWDQWDGRDKTYHSPHFSDKPNVVVHFRTQEIKDSNGEKGLLIETIQSDWHQERGKSPEEDFRYLDRLIDNDEISFSEYERRVKELEESGSKVPPAPFERTWAEVGLKHALDIAAQDPSVKWVGWSSGKVQNERWGKSPEQIAQEWDMDNPTFEAMYDDYFDRLVRKEEEKLGRDLTEEENTDLSDMAYDAVADNPPTPKEGGGTFLETLYDKRLPKFAKKYAEKLGGKYRDDVLTGGSRGEKPDHYRIEQQDDGWYIHDDRIGDYDGPFSSKQEAERVLIVGGEGEQYPIHRIDLTDQFRSHINTKGQEFYQMTGPVAGAVVKAAIGGDDNKKKKNRAKELWEKRRRVQ